MEFRTDETFSVKIFLKALREYYEWELRPDSILTKAAARYAKLNLDSDEDIIYLMLQFKINMNHLIGLEFHLQRIEGKC